MWFRRKTKNRRFERDHVLEVKLRSQQARALRIRLFTRLSGVLMALGLTVFLACRGVEWAITEFIYKNDAFAIREVEINTDGILPPPQIQKWAGIRPGMNLLALDLTRIKRDLELVPAIQNVAVERVLPKTLRLRVTEREPMARISVFQHRAAANTLEQKIFYLDSAGYVMQPMATPGMASIQPESLPVITGIAGTELRPGRAVESRQIHAALRLIEAFERSPMMGVVDLKCIDLSATQVLHVTTEQGSEVVFAMDNLGQQLRRWRLVHDFGSRTGKALASLDLSVSNNVPARWLEASAAPPAPVKPAKPPRYRKKHV
ncbi:MAG: FtsQ-type POTRA domain-containing protein [Verrucomicrobiota bacterium]